MKLNNKELENKKVWTDKGYNVLSYDRKKMIENTHNNPMWVHFGAGNIFRIFPAKLCQTLLENGLTDRGIIVGEGFDYEIISKAYAPFDNMTLMVTLKADGTIDKDIVGSVAEAYPFDYSFLLNLNDKKIQFEIPAFSRFFCWGS